MILQHAGLSPPPGPFPELPHSVDPCGMLAGTPAFRLTGVPAPCFIRTTQNKPGPKALSTRSAQLRAATFTWEGCRQPLSCQNHEAHRTHRIYRLHLFFCDKSVPRVLRVSLAWDWRYFPKPPGLCLPTCGAGGYERGALRQAVPRLHLLLREARQLAPSCVSLTATNRAGMFPIIPLIRGCAVLIVMHYILIEKGCFNLRLAV